jgi:hypothetical protein
MNTLQHNQKLKNINLKFNLTILIKLLLYKHMANKNTKQKRKQNPGQTQARKSTKPKVAGSAKSDGMSLIDQSKMFYHQPPTA